MTETRMTIREAQAVRLERGRSEALKDVVAEYVETAIKSFDRDPADTAFQRGYLKGMKQAKALLTKAALPTSSGD